MSVTFSYAVSRNPFEVPKTTLKRGRLADGNDARFGEFLVEKDSGRKEGRVRSLVPGVAASFSWIARMRQKLHPFRIFLKLIVTAFLTEVE